MRLYISTPFTCLLLIVVLTFSSSLLIASPPEIELAGRSISMELVTDNDDLTLTAWPNEQVNLVTDTAMIKKGDNIADLLKARGIRPDAESYTLVYDLNPRLEKVDPLAVGSSITLPKVIGGAQLRQKFASGHIVMITVDKQLKDKLKKNADAVSALSPRFAALKADNFADSSKRQDTIKAVKDLADWFNRIQKSFAERTAKPIRRDTLLQVADESDVLRLILEQVHAPKLKLSRENQGQISAIHEDIKEIIRLWDNKQTGEIPSVERKYRVEVKILGNDPNKIGLLRVYYVIAGKFLTSSPTPFNGLGSGSSADLPIKDYKVWAAQDGEPTKPVTPVTDLPVRKIPDGEIIKLDLSIRP
jgi:hypothetical protein